MIVGLSGRKNTGKTTLSDLLIKRGFKRASFATPLKEYVAQLFDWDLQSLYTQAGKEEILSSPVIWNIDVCKKLEDIANIKLNFIEDALFNSRRDILQFIGTDVLRAADPDFHVNKFAEKFLDGDYVVDDVRFMNEVETLKKINGFSAHVVRPYNWIYSNHDSEISVTRKDVDCVILNHVSKEVLIDNFDLFLDDLLSGKENSEEIYKNINKNYDINDMFLTPDKKSSYWAGFITYAGLFKDKHIEFNPHYAEIIEGIEGIDSFLTLNKSGIIDSPFIIDDLKLWNLNPDSMDSNIHFPKCILDNREFRWYFLAGWHMISQKYLI